MPVATPPAPAAAPAAAKPAAAAAKPAPASPSPPSVSPQTTTVSERPVEKLNRAFGALDEMIAAAPASPKPAAPQAEPKTQTPAAEKPAEQPKESHAQEVREEKEEVGLDEPLFDEEEAPAQPEAEAKDERPKVATLRQMFDAEKKTTDALRKEIAQLKAQKPQQEGPDPKQLLGEVQALRKEREQLLEELRFSDFTKHPDFREKFEKPYERAWNLGRAWVAQLKVKDPTTGNERQGTPQDFDDLMSLNNTAPDRAAEALDLLFGQKAASVASYMTRVNESLSAMQEAREEFRTKGSQREKERQEEFAKAATEVRTAVENAWRKHSAEPVEKFPQYFKPVEGDEKGNALLEKGYRQAQFALSHLNPADPNLNQQQRETVVRAHAAMYHKAAAFQRLAYQLKQRDARVSELEAELAAYRKSEPKAGEGGRPAKPETATWEQQLEALARH